MEAQPLLPHHKNLLETGDATVYPIVYETACFGEGGFPLAVSIFIFCCLEAYYEQSMVIEFCFWNFKKKYKCRPKELQKSINALLKYKCIEYVKGKDNRKKYIKILV